MKNLPGFIVAETNPEIRQAIFESLSSNASDYLTICEQLRFIYDSVVQIQDKELKEDITQKLIDAFNMGKKMNSRLDHYHRLLNDRTGSSGKNLIRIPHRRHRRFVRSHRNNK